VFTFTGTKKPAKPAEPELEKAGSRWHAERGCLGVNNYNETGGYPHRG